MNLHIFLHVDDAPGLSALLQRMHMWGQLNWYDMDEVFKTVESPAQRMFFVFPLPGLDWRTFADLCLRLFEEKSRPITRLDALHIDCVSEDDRKTYDFTTFVKRLHDRGAP
jgi:hypothetical protein